MTPSRRLRQRPRPVGFTLIELMVASVLAVTLMVALVLLLQSIGRSTNLVRRVADARPPTELLEQQLQRDILHATHIRADGGQLRLRGMLARDRATGMPTLRPAEVLYRSRIWDGRHWLVREERALNAPSSRLAREVIWADAASIEVVGLDDRAMDDPESSVTESDIAEMQPVGEWLIIVVRDDRGDRLCSTEIFHHTFY